MTQPELLKEEGQALVEIHNEYFVQAMRDVAAAFAYDNGSVTVDDLRDYAIKHNIQPKHPNAWGAVFRKTGLKPTGFTKSKFASNHARMIRVWAFV